MEPKRLHYLDMAKGIGIILVVMGHAPYTPDWLKNYIATFHMPLFFVISGILLFITGEERKPYKELLAKKFRLIMGPYISFSLVYLALDSLNVLIAPDKLAWVDVARNSIHAATLYGISVLWFLNALFISELLFLGIRRRCGHKLTVFLTVVCALAGAYIKIWMDNDYPLFRNMAILSIGYITISICRAAVAMAFLSLGYYVCRYVKGHEYSKWQEWLAIAALCTVNILLSRINGGVDLHFMQLNNPILYLICGGAGSLGLILLCRQLPKIRPLEFFGRNSLIVMVTHLDFRVLIMAIHYAMWMNQYITRAKTYVLYLNIIMAVIVLEVIWIYIINHWFPFLLGKWYAKGRKEHGVKKFGRE